jgi:hypothetical protein
MFLLINIFIILLPLFTSLFYSGFNNKIIYSYKKYLNMNSFDNTPFVNLLNYNFEITKKLNFTPVSIHENFITKKTIKDSGILHNYCFSNKYFRKFRFTYIDVGSKNQYFGLVLHPIYKCDAPILNFELISYNNEKIVFMMNMIKMDNTKHYNDRYVSPFLTFKKKYPELKENLAVKMTNYTILGNYISEAILLGKFTQKNNNFDKLDNIYNNIIFSSFEDYLNIYFHLIYNITQINNNDLTNNNDLINIKNRHKLFDMKKAFTESKYEIRKYFDDKWYNSMLYDFFYDLSFDDL